MKSPMFEVKQHTFMYAAHTVAIVHAHPNYSCWFHYTIHGIATLLIVWPFKRSHCTHQVKVCRERLIFATSHSCEHDLSNKNFSAYLLQLLCMISDESECLQLIWICRVSMNHCRAIVKPHSTNFESLMSIRLWNASHYTYT